MRNGLIKAILVAAFAVVASVNCIAAGDPAMVAKVKSGELKEARVSWWGFNPDDSTQYFQEAINSKVPRLIVDKMPNTWYLTPIKCVSNQEIVFEEGAKVAAKRFAFQGKRDMLFTLDRVANVAFRGTGTEIKMFRDDYAKEPYDFTRVGERDAFYVHASENITIEGLNLIQCGGTAINLTAGDNGKKPCKNIKVSNCNINKSCRRGIMVSGSDGVEISNTTISETSGNWPHSAICVYTEGPEMPLRNVSFKNCTFESCSGYGIEVIANGQWTAESPTVSVSFENCAANDVEVGFHYSGGSTPGKYPRGLISLKDCTISHTRRNAVKITQKPFGGIKVEFANSKLVECCTRQPSIPDIDIFAGRNDDPPVDDLVLNGVEIHHGNAKRPWIAPFEGNWMAEEVKNISGKVRIMTQSAKKDISLDGFWRKSNFPAKSRGATPPRVQFKFGPNVAVTDLVKGAPVQLSPLVTRSTSKYAFCVEKARTVHIKGRYIAVNKQRNSSPIVIREYGSDKVVAEVPLPDFHEKGNPDGEITFDVPQGGFYSMVIRPGHNNFMLTNSDVPIALDVSEYAQTCVGSECSVWFTPARGKQFAVFTCGSAAFEIQQPNGKVMLKGVGARDWSRFLGSAGGINDVWSMNFTKPKHGFGEYKIDMTGMPGFFFLSNKKYWRVK